ncbi:MAG: flavin oxidoreductase [Saprospiraceae bacterium]|nr:flavin oxidoreductase [Saprospiraceae bacterium]
MELTDVDIKELDRIKRLNIINSLTGIKPANLIGTVSDTGLTNLAIFSSVIHLGSNPPLLGFILRPDTQVRRDTFENITQNGQFTINHVHSSFTEKAHYTSAKFSSDISEFERCKLTEEYLDSMQAPFVKESILKIGLECVDKIPIELNKTTLIIGKIKIVILPDDSVDVNGHINLELLETAGISGLNSYYSLQKIAQYPYARPEQLPEF